MPSIPHLIHPIATTFERISRSTTRYDVDAREPIQQAARLVAVVLPAQPRWRRLDQTSMEFHGDRREARGYLLLRKVDMDAILGLNVLIEIGDKITQIGHQTVEYFVIDREWIGHLQSHNGPSLLKTWFADRRPSKQSGV